MSKTIDMQLMRYINLFAKIAKVQTHNCFVYNNTIYFAVPKKDVTKALGKNASNVKKISETLRKRVRVISKPKTELVDSDKATEEKENALKTFVAEIVAPVEFSSFDFKPEENTVTISGTREQKAMMIGRDRVRQKELQEILDRNFGVKVVRFS